MATAVGLFAGLIGPAASELALREQQELLRSMVDPASIPSPEQAWGMAADLPTQEGERDDDDLWPRSALADHPQLEMPPTPEAEPNTAEPVAATAPEAAGFDPETSRELPDERAELERTFANADGTLTTEFSQEPVNFLDEQGSWQPVDPTLVEVEGGGWRNSADSVDIRIAPEASGTISEFTVADGGTVGLALEQADAVAGVADGDLVAYAEVRPGVDVEIESRPGGVTQRLILHSAEAAQDVVLPLRTSDLTASLVDGSAVLADEAGAEQALIAVPTTTDANRDDRSGDYRDPGTSEIELVEGEAGEQALRVVVDSEWLADPAREFPVIVTASVETLADHDGAGSTDSVSVMRDGSGSTWKEANDEIKVGTVGSGVDRIQSAGYLKFGGVETRLRNHRILGARLNLHNFHSYSCQPRRVTVHGVTAPWSSGDSLGYPGPAHGSSLGSANFAYGHIVSGSTTSNCPNSWAGISLGSGGTDLIQGWVSGSRPNHGLTVRASESDVFGWKRFTSHRTANPPRLSITHSPYDADYRFVEAVPEPPVTRTQGGTIQLEVTNRGAQTWTPSTYALEYRLFRANGSIISTRPAARLTGDVPRGSSVTLEANINPLEPGDYWLDFTMRRTGSTFFTDHQVPPARLALRTFEIPPVLTAQYPHNGHLAPTLTPQLWAAAIDVDAPPDASLDFKFEICGDGACHDSGWQDSQTWTVPEGLLRWSQEYTWKAFAGDGATESEAVGDSTLITAVPQPEITAHLGNAPYSANVRDFDAQVGNYFSSAMDVSVRTAGPALNVLRTYNSLDPRRDLAFGSGWASTYDMRVVPDADGSGNVVVTYPDGQQVRFGRNPTGTFSAPQGRYASLSAVPEGGWALFDKSRTTYRFNDAGRLTSILDAHFRAMNLGYDSAGLLQTASSRPGGRSLHFTWADGHVTSVTTDAVDGEALRWTYAYDGDRLVEVCDPTDGCTRYDYTEGSHYRTTVLDSRPDSYWRLGEPGGAVATSQVGLHLGEDDGTHHGVELGVPGALSGTGETAARFDGTASRVALPAGAVRKSRDLAIELWFRTTDSGPLVGFQTREFGSSPGGSLPALYVGTDGRLYGQWWQGEAEPIGTTETVNDGEWHHAVLSGSLATQTLYLDGAEVGSRDGEIDMFHTHGQLGVSYQVGDDDWPGWPGQSPWYFEGDIDEVALYQRPLGLPAVQAHYAAAATSAQLVELTLPSGRIAGQITYDDVNERVSEYTDRDGGTWRLGVPHYGGSTDNPIRSTDLADPAGRQHHYDFDPLHGRALRYVSPVGLTVREEDLPPDAEPVDPPDCDLTEEGFCSIPVRPGDDWGNAQPVQGQGVRTLTYDESGFQQTITDELGQQVTFTNDERGNRLSTRTCRTSNADCHTTRYSYFLNPGQMMDPRNDRLIAVRDGRSSGADDDRFRTTYTYDNDGELITEVAPDGGTTRHTYSEGGEAAIGGGNVPAGMLLASTDANGAVTSRAYYSSGDLAEVTLPSGLRTRYTYDALGRTVVETEFSDSFPDGVTTTTAYDALSRPVETIAPATTNAVHDTGHLLHTTTAYDADGNTVRVATQDGPEGDPRVSTVDFNEQGRAERVTDPEGGETSYGYDHFGNNTWTVDAAGNRFEYAYTPTNQIAEVRLRGWNGDPEDVEEQPQDYLVLEANTYDRSGRRAYHSDAMGRLTHFEYFYDGLLRRVTHLDVADPDGGERDIVAQENTYDAAGNLIGQVDAEGLDTEITVDAVGRITRTDTAGPRRSSAFTHDPVGNVTSVTHAGVNSNVPGLGAASPHVTEFEYDEAGRPVTETVVNDGERLTTRRAFDQRGLLITETDPRGAVQDADPAAFTTDLAYDEVGRLVSVTAPPVPVEKPGAPAETIRPTAATGYNAFGDVVAQRDPNGEITEIDYDDLGREIRLSSPSYLPPGSDEPIRLSTETSYDALSNVLSVTDGAGNSTRFVYDQLSRLTEVHDPPRIEGAEPGVWQYSYTRVGELRSATDPTGARVEATYDDLGRQLTHTALERHPTTGAFTTDLRYDDVGNLLSTTDPSGDTTTYEYDVLYQPIRTIDAAGVRTETGYDALGRPLRAVDGAGRVTLARYDQAGRILTETSRDPESNARLRETSFTHDAAGNQTGVTDPVGATSTFVYDALGRVVEQTEPVAEGESITTSLGYDAAGNPTRFTDGRGHATYTGYNSLGLVESVIEPATEAHPAAADRTWTTAYDVVGDPVRMVSPGGVTRDRVFDALGNLVRENGSGAEAPTGERVLDYDALGRVTAAGTPAGLNTYGYDDRGNLVTAGGPGGVAQFGYDASGRPVSRIDDAGQATFSYDDGRLASVADGLTGVGQELGYDEAGQLSSIDYGDGRVRALIYDEFGRQTGDVLTDAGGAEITAIEYGFDLADRLTSKTTSGTAGAGENTYGYDLAGRLTSWASPAGETTEYDWDGAGNRIAVGDKTAAYDERNRLLSDGDYTYEHTARGTVAGRDSSGLVEEFSFDAFDRLIARGGTTYDYDALDRVVARNGVGGFSYAGLSIEPVSDGASVFGRGPDDELLAWSDADAVALAVSDRHGDVIGGLPVTGAALTGSRAYDPFGQVVDTAGSTGIIGFQGDWTDPDTGMTNMGARWYDPASAAFLSRDDIDLPSSPSILTNRYTYGAGAPTNFVDPDGHLPWAVWLAIEAAKQAAKYCARNPRKCADAGNSIVDGISNAWDSMTNRKVPGSASAAPPSTNGWYDQANNNCFPTCAASGNNGGGWGHWFTSFWAGMNWSSGSGGGSGFWYLSGPGSGSGGGTWTYYVPPPPDPAIEARRLNRENAIENPVALPDGWDDPWYGDGPEPSVSTSPSLPAWAVGDLSDRVEDVAASYEQLQRDLLDSSGPVITNISVHDQAPSEVSYTDPTNLTDAGSCDTSNSFAAGTEVLMADGSTKPIEDVGVGDEVLATDPTTGETSVQLVTATIVGDGVKQLVDVTIVTEDGGTDTITATAEHPFWVADLNAWVNAEDLEPGHRFETADHRDASVTAVDAYDAPRQVRNLTVGRLHTYYLLAGQTPVLVHNSGGHSPDDGMVTVGRWMSGAEHQAMMETGMVQRGGGGFTYVVYPASRDAYISARPGSVYAEFDVPQSSLIPGGRPGDFKMSDSDTIFARLAQKKGNPVPQLPEAKNIKLGGWGCS
ncbi:DNRLRE domain-containing protein [Actinoalloteichus sp. GBA129-24]|uniref:TreTu family toxin n=1 Tax=Actinoalloteichus sp. GBA129-24 TaxID=1612551 RepID=UPI00095054F3|nr:DNRLRE domain-containing protein [Actinoalloteichus sp. GBA129-24]APU19207.1 RHS repeat-associated core domain [Actinoalloteichus sp. GBA129-24]